MMEYKYQDLSRFILPPGFRGRNALIVQLWWVVQDTLFRLSPQALYSWRRWLLRIFGAKIGNGAIIRPTARITYPWKLTVGDNAWIGDHAELYNLANITIHDNAVVSQHAYLCTGSHDFESIDFSIYAKPIIVEREAWICAGAFVHPGVTVGLGALIGARAVLGTNAEPGYIYMGFPAKKIRLRKPIRNNDKHASLSDA